MIGGNIAGNKRLIKRTAARRATRIRGNVGVPGRGKRITDPTINCGAKY